jgi:hypothetical protein
MAAKQWVEKKPELKFYKAGTGSSSGKMIPSNLDL